MLPQADIPLTNGASVNPLLNGCTTLVTNTNINVTYLNGSINGVNKQYDEKFKMHQGFIAVLKVRKCEKKYFEAHPEINVITIVGQFRLH